LSLLRTANNALSDVSSEFVILAAGLALARSLQSKFPWLPPCGRSISLDIMTLLLDLTAPSTMRRELSSHYGTVRSFTAELWLPLGSADGTTNLSRLSGPLVFPRGTPQGTSTRTILDLNRGELAERRREQLERVMGVFDTILRNDVPLPAKRAIYADLIPREGARSAPYSAMTNALIKQMQVVIPTGL
jgi:hypothetical protein